MFLSCNPSLLCMTRRNRQLLHGKTTHIMGLQQTAKKPHDLFDTNIIYDYHTQTHIHASLTFTHKKKHTNIHFQTCVASETKFSTRVQSATLTLNSSGPKLAPMVTHEFLNLILD